MVDLDPITYETADGVEVTKEQVTGKYTKIVEAYDEESLPASQRLKYEFTLDNAPILPGSLMIRVNNGQYILRDNNNGQIFNIDNILAKKGKIDYVTGDVSIEFNSPINIDLVVNYTHNKAVLAPYKNLSTQTFFYDESSLEKDDMQDLV